LVNAKFKGLSGSGCQAGVLKDLKWDKMLRGLKLDVVRGIHPVGYHELPKLSMFIYVQSE